MTSSDNNTPTLKERLQHKKDNSIVIVAIAAVATLLHELRQVLEDIPWIKEKMPKIVNPDYVWWGVALLGAVIIVAVAGKIVWPFVMRRYFEPQSEDPPLIALRKAKRSGASMRLVKLDNKLDHYFVYREKANYIWVAPEIRYRWIAPSDSTNTEQDFSDRLNSDYDSKEPHYITRLFDSVEKAVRDKSIELFWYHGKSDSKVGPMRINSSSKQSVAQSLRPIVRERSRD